MPQPPYINIHKHGLGISDGEIAIRSIFAHDIPKVVGVSKGPLSIGIHPWHIDKKTVDEQMALIEKATHHKSVAAIGEIGLDRLTSASFDLQKEIFGKQLKIAARVDKPVIIHCVKAHSDIISMVNKAGFQGKVIFHGFNQNRQIAEQLLKNDFYLSFGQALLNDNSNAKKIFSQIPDEKFFLETDEAELTIKDIYERAARLKNTSIENIIKIVSDNFARCFTM